MNQLSVQAGANASNISSNIENFVLDAFERCQILRKIEKVLDEV